MRRKNFILIVFMFLFVNILSMAIESTNFIMPNTNMSSSSTNFQEALKDYKPNLENIDKIFNYIEKNIKEKGKAIFYSKLEKNEVIVTDENNNLLQTMNYKNNKMIVEQQVEGNQVKIVYFFNDTNSMSGKSETYINGKLLSVSIFKNGKMNGVIKMYYENGKIGAVYNIKDNIQDGEAIEYDEDGNVIRKVLYKNGEIIK